MKVKHLTVGELIRFLQTVNEKQEVFLLVDGISLDIVALETDVGGEVFIVSELFDT